MVPNYSLLLYMCILVAVTSRSFLPANLLSCKSWLDLLIGTGLGNFLLIGAMLTEEEVLAKNG